MTRTGSGMEGRERGDEESVCGSDRMVTDVDYALDAGPQVIRLLLVDDQLQVLRGLRMRLSLEPDVVVVGDALDARLALSLVEQLQPDVVIMDVELPGMDGIEATEALRRAWPGTRVVMLSMHDDEETQARARSAGASAFVAKHRAEGLLLSAIRGAAGHAATH